MRCGGVVVSSKKESKVPVAMVQAGDGYAHGKPACVRSEGHLQPRPTALCKLACVASQRLGPADRIVEIIDE